MSDTHWKTVKQAGVVCPICQHDDKCNVSPDGNAFKCWRDGGKVHQVRMPTTRMQRPDSCGKHSRPKPERRTFLSAAEAIAAYRLGDPVATWTYQDAQGDAVLTVARWDKPDGGKDIRPAGRVDAGWVMGDPSTPFPLYRLPELQAADPAQTVFVCEGEKATDAAVSIGLLAITSAHGSCSAAKTDWTPLAGRDVVILPDNDEPGQKYTDNVAAILAELDPPATVRRVNLPELPIGGDIVEYLDSLDSKEPEDLRRGIEALAADATPVKPIKAGPVLMRMSDVEAREVSWLWPKRIPAGRLTLIVGRPGEGKSFLTMDMAARVTTGTPWPDGTPCPQGSVILIVGEDDPHDTIRPRLDAHHADVSKVHLLRMRRIIREDGTPIEIPFTLADVETLRQTLALVPDCRLVIIDPIGSFLGGGVDAHRDNEVRGVLVPITDLAEKSGAAVVMVAHRRKSGGDTADDTALGSRAFTGLARAVWHVTREKGEPTRRLFLPGKNNLASKQGGLAFSIVGEPIGQVQWERDPVTIEADDLMTADREPTGPKPEQRRAAEEWLRELLSSGPVATEQVKADAKGADFKWATVRRAADSLDVQRRKLRCPPYPWQWSLPEPKEEDAQCEHLPAKQEQPEQ